MGRFFEARKATIMARNKSVSKAFTRVVREITTAVKAGGEDPDTNPALRRAIQNGRAVSMPRDTIEGAIKRALGQTRRTGRRPSTRATGPTASR